MARTVTVIQNEIISQMQGNPVIGPLWTSTSGVGILRAIAFIVATSIWTLETLFDVFKSDVDETIAALKPHSPRWYAEKAKSFQYGYDLVDESDYYDNTGLDETDVANSKIVDYAAVVEAIRGLRIKVANDNGTDLVPLTEPQLTAFKAYMQRVKDGGVKLDCTSTNPDSLKLTIDLYYNPLVLNAAGQRLDGESSEPVQDGSKEYLKNLPFNGVFVLQSLTDALQKVDGVVIADIKDASARYGALPYQSFAVKYLPDAGYLRIVDNADLIINFIPYSE